MGGSNSNPPYSYLQNGQALGFDNDLMREVANILGMEVKFQLTPLAEAKENLENGTVDVIGGLAYFDRYEKGFLFGTPHAVQYYDLFIRRDSHIRSLSDIEGKTVIVQNGDIMEDYFNGGDYPVQTVLAETPLEALTWGSFWNL